MIYLPRWAILNFNLPRRVLLRISTRRFRASASVPKNRHRSIEDQFRRGDVAGFCGRDDHFDDLRQALIEDGADLLDRPPSGIITAFTFPGHC
ncbi:MAG: hypothetical protein ACREXX_08910 [Gammaproteobacteria bacterium]